MQAVLTCQYHHKEKKMSLLARLNLLNGDSADAGAIEIMAPLSGEIVNIEDVPDVVFAEKIVGDGIAIKPAGNKIVAPVTGVIGKIFKTNHAFSIVSDDWVEIFVHFGIDTDKLQGEGFKRIADEGQSVNVGETIIEFDLALLEQKAKSTLTPVVVSNMDEIQKLSKLSGSVAVGETPILRVTK
jgi:PTS system glucose-specific IIA component